MPNLKTLEKDISSIFYKKGLELFEKQKVREIDEEGTGNFVAFVDDGKLSHDVQVKVQTKTFEILSHACDCNELTPFCQHKVAVALQIAKKGTKTSTGISKKLKVKKKSKTEELLDSIDELDLKIWLLEQLEENKSLNFKFFYRFEAKETEVDVKTVLAKTQEIVKAVLGKSKHLDLNRLIAILSLWKPYHDEVFAVWLNKIHLPEEFSALVSTINAVAHYRYQLNTTSNKLEKYHEYLTEKILERLYSQTHEEKVETITNMIKAFDHEGVINYVLPYHGLLACEAIPEPQQTTLLQLFTKVLTPKLHYLEQRTLLTLFERFKKMGQFAVGHTLFKPLYAQDAYNLQVIEELLKIDKLVLALEFTGKCINYNSYEEYNVPYYKQLVLIHQLMQQPAEALHYRTLLLPMTLEIEELKSIFQEQLQDSVRRSLVAKLNSRINSRSNVVSVIAFKMAFYEIVKQRKKIQDCLQDDFEWSTMDEQLAPAIALDQVGAIDRIVQLYSPGNYFAQNSAYFTALLDSIEPKILAGYMNKIKYVPTNYPYYKIFQSYMKKLQF